MERSDDIRSLTQDILASCEARMNAVGQLVADTHTMLGDFTTAHTEMSARLRESLAEFGHDLETSEAERVAEARSDIKQRQEETKQWQEEVERRIDQVNSLLGDLRSAHTEMSARLRQSLAEFGQELDRSEAKRAEQAHADLKERQEETKQGMDQVSRLLGDLRSAHTEMSTRLRQSLAEFGRELDRSEAERAEHAQSDLKERQAEAKQGMDRVNSLLSGLRSAHAAMSTHLKGELARTKSELAREGTERLEQAQTTARERLATIQERVATVGELLGEFQAERQKAAAAWQQLGSIMQGKRGMTAPAAKADPEAPSVEEGPTTAPEPADTAPATTDLSEMVLAFVAGRPDGARMTELEAEFGVARIQMARVLKGLMAEEKVEKRDMLYFAV